MGKKRLNPINQNKKKVCIRFRNQELNNLREHLLADLENEHYACLFAKRQVVKDLYIFTVVEAVFPNHSSYIDQGQSSLHLDGSFMRQMLLEVDSRMDVDSIIDVHTHPFSAESARFSGIDDRDENAFVKYLDNEAADIFYASIVFSQNMYAARYWEMGNNSQAVCYPAIINTQKASEQIRSFDEGTFSAQGNQIVGDMFNRSVLTLGLDVMRTITQGQEISIVGVGGIGSIMAEHLIHMGFNKINLIDFDILEISNLNRVVGVKYSDATSKRLKVEAIRDNLQLINPQAVINAYPLNVFDVEVEYVIARSNWILVATDNHASRYHVQNLAFKYYVPFITSGVNITVENQRILDMSGEVILVHIGDRVCLNCLKRINYNEVAKVIHPDSNVRVGLINSGYVKGKDIKEPAVKTLNTHLATMAVDVLINQYTERRNDSVILVYEENEFPTIYEDRESLENRSLHCSICGD